VKVLVTGVTGLLGGEIASRLAGDGHDVRRFGGEAGDDLHDPGIMRRACAGCEAVVHAAAEASPWIRDRRAFDKTNVQGFGNVSQAARDGGSRLIYLSSCAALGPTDGAVFDEQTTRATMTFQSDHERTMWVADQMARHLAAAGMDIVRLYPGIVFGGVRNRDDDDAVGLLVRAAGGRPARMPGGGGRLQCFAYIDDVVDGAARALVAAPVGAAYILGGENRSAREFIATFAKAAGSNGRWRGMPLPLAALAGRLRRWGADLFGISPRMPDSLVRFYRHEWAYSSELARQELGYRITPFEEAIASMVQRLGPVALP
jgi:farnesol dehydrogenase